jgi:DNA helicase-2/ATP-dependent DNA helicase PcrA
MTLHAAKGLEFDAVALTGLEEGVLPSGHALYAEELVEEERRLVYVGITRAREYALITHARYRVIYGSASDQRTSRFIREIIDGGALQLEIGSWPTMHISSWLTQWLQDSAPAVASEPKLSPATAVHLTPEKAEAKNGHAQWRIGQQVKHASFGLGIISGVEERASATTLLIKFGGTHRKIAASFIQEV